MGISEELGAGLGDDDGTYDLNALKQAKEAIGDNKDVDTDGMVDVDPLFIQVSAETPVRTEELKSRMVIVEYDAYDEVVSVELL